MPKQSNVSRTIVDDEHGDVTTAPTGDKDLELNAKRELFCELFASDREFFGNGTESYAEAYGYDLSNPAKYAAAAAGASRLLKNAKVLLRINEILEVKGLNDEFVDKQLAFVIVQNADFGSKIAAIREYNKLKGRIIEKSIKMNVPIPQPLLGGDSRGKKIEEAIEGEVVEERTVTVKRKS